MCEIEHFQVNFNDKINKAVLSLEALEKYSTLFDFKERTHYSQGVEHEAPGVVVCPSFI